ncbi:hypothetical protein GOE08_27030 [Sinorhizobium medicae]|nr:hypothetical protein [Sinorhizobium medicae]
MNVKKKALLAGAVLASSLFSTAAFAGGGVFDALDPCIEQRDQFRAERIAYLEVLDKNIADAEHAQPTPEYHEAWSKAKRAQLRSTFDTLVAPTLKDLGQTDMDSAYSKWFDKGMEEMGPQNVEALVAANFRQELNQLRIEQRATGEAELQSAKADLDKACKMDVGNQALRGVVTAVTAPIGMVSRNLEIAKRESDLGAKILAGGTGISIDAINKNGGVFGGGLSGGPNSFFRKNLGIRF